MITGDAVLTGVCLCAILFRLRAGVSPDLVALSVAVHVANAVGITDPGKKKLLILTPTEDNDLEWRDGDTNAPIAPYSITTLPNMADKYDVCATGKVRESFVCPNGALSWLCLRWAWECKSVGEFVQSPQNAHKLLTLPQAVELAVQQSEDFWLHVHLVKIYARMTPQIKEAVLKAGSPQR